MKFKKANSEHCFSNKYITTQEFNKLTAEKFSARLKQANLAIKADIDDFVEKKDFNDKSKKLHKKNVSNKTKHVEVWKKITDLSSKVTQISEKSIWFFVRQNKFYR